LYLLSILNYFCHSLTLKEVYRKKGGDIFYNDVARIKFLQWSIHAHQPTRRNKPYKITKTNTCVLYYLRQTCANIHDANHYH